MSFININRKTSPEKGEVKAFGKRKKIIVLVAGLLAIATLATGVTLAFLFDKSDPIPNTFTPSKVSIEVTETFDGSVKSNVNVKNTGDVEIYLRAVVIATWVKNVGTAENPQYVTHSQVPKLDGLNGQSGDFIIDEGDGNSFDFVVNRTEEGSTEAKAWWKKSVDGFWYYLYPVKPGESTEVSLISTCKVVEGANPPGEGYILSIEVVATAIQSKPLDAVSYAGDSGIYPNNPILADGALNVIPFGSATNPGESIHPSESQENP